MNRKPRHRLTWADVAELGTVAGWRYVTFDGYEYIVDQAPMFSTEAPLGPDEIRIATQRERVDFGTTTTYTETYRCTRVPDGSYAAALAAPRHGFRGPRPHRPIDLIARMPALAGRSDMVLPVSAPMPPGSLENLEAEATIAAMPTRGRMPGFIAGRPAVSTPSAILDHLARQGVTLTLTAGGRLLATTAGGRMTDELLNVVMRCERLLVGLLTGHPVLCELGHGGPAPEAVTVVAVDVPACAEHAAGRLPATVEPAKGKARSA